MRALLIDDHPLILSALRTVIEGLGEDVAVVGAGSARAARETLAADSDFDLALLDLQLGDANGFELLGELRSAHPALPVVVVSASDRSYDVMRAISLGAMGFIPKRASNETLHEAIRAVLAGDIYLPPMTLNFDAPAGAGEMKRAAADDLALARPQPMAARAAAPRPLEALGLTPRQKDVLGLLLKGQSNKLIARELNLSVETVKDHVAAVLRSLNVNSRTQAVVAVNQMTSPGAHHPWSEPTRK